MADTSKLKKLRPPACKQSAASYGLLQQITPHKPYSTSTHMYDSSHEHQRHDDAELGDALHW
jgi:hypothetical protein